MPRPELKNAPGADGFIIVAVLWILAALAALASVYADVCWQHGNGRACLRL